MATENDRVVNITIQLKGEWAEKFLAYKEKIFLVNNSEAARQLMLERLREVASEAGQVVDPTAAAAA